MFISILPFFIISLSQVQKLLSTPLNHLSLKPEPDSQAHRHYNTHPLQHKLIQVPLLVIDSVLPHELKHVPEHQADLREHQHVPGHGHGGLQVEHLVYKGCVEVLQVGFELHNVPLLMLSLSDNLLLFLVKMQ